MENSMAKGGVTQINADYLNKLKASLQEILTEVEQQLTGMGTTGVTSSTTNYISPVDNTLTAMAGSTNFNAAAAFNNALKSMGGSVHNQLEWLKKVLTHITTEITNP